MYFRRISMVAPPVETIAALSKIPADKSVIDSFQVVDKLDQLNCRVRLKKQVDMVFLPVELNGPSAIT
jgi:hypothetical protein